MKKSEITFNALLVPVDFLAIVLAGLTAYYLRYSALYEEYIREVIFSLPLNIYFNYLLVIGLGSIFIFALSGLYAMKIQQKFIDHIAKIFFACSTAALAVIVGIFFKRELFSSRFIILAAWILSFIYVTFFHLMIRLIQRSLYKKGIGVYRVVLVGDNQIARSVDLEFKNSPELGYQVIKKYADVTGDNWQEELIALLKSHQIDAVLVADSTISAPNLKKIYDYTLEFNVVFKYAADILGTLATNIDVHFFAGFPIIEVKKTKLDGWGRVIKRISDLTLAGFLLVLFVPLFVVVALAIKIDSQGPIFVKLPRVGNKGRVFYLYKFRSMIVGAANMKSQLHEQNERKGGPLFKIKDDPRITKVGKFIRAYSIDELPNFWNVLKGEMSVVGPRPHEPQEIAQYQLHEKHLLDIKPGVTGLAQVSGRSDLSFEEEVRLDTFYIENWSFLFDFWIIYKTPFVVLTRKSAC